MKNRPLLRVTKWWRTISFMAVVCPTEICVDTIQGWVSIIYSLEVVVQVSTDAIFFFFFFFFWRQFFFKHPLMEKYKWYWRIEWVKLHFVAIFIYLFISYSPFRPHVQFHCDILYDPFLFMEEHKKVYCMLFFSLFMSLRSFNFWNFYSFYNYDVRIFSHDPNTMETCHGFVFFPLKDNLSFFKLHYYWFRIVSDFAHDHPEYIAKDNSLGFMSSDNGQNYNLCHC